MAQPRSNRRTTASTTRTASAAAPTRSTEILGFIPERFRSAAWILLLIVMVIAFFSGPVFNGEYFSSNDNISWESYRPYLEKMDELGQSPQWMPYIFSGMPGVASYMVTGDRSWDLTMKTLLTVQDGFSMGSDVMRILFYYLLLGIGVYFLMRSKNIDRSISFLTSFATIFSTWIIVWIMIGHNTKPMVLAFLPWVILFTDKLLDRWSLLWAGLFILAIHYLVESAHPQTTFYCAALIGIWLVVELIFSLVRKERKRTIRIASIAALGIVAGGFALAMGWDRFSVALNEYNDYSTRGVDPIVAQATTQDPYDYATGWSYDVDETFTFLVPAYFGFGKLALKDINEKNPSFFYWGNEHMPFTDAAHYMGIVVLLLALFGIWKYRENPFIVGMSAAGLFGLLISFGANFPIIYNILYKVVPKFSQFRAPSQSLVMLEFVGPILAGFGLMALIYGVSTRQRKTDESKLAKYFLYGSIGAAVFLLIGFAVRGGYAETVASQPSFQQMFQGQVPPQVTDALTSLMFGDWVVSALFAAAFCLLAWAYLRGKISGTILVVAVLLLTVIDLWRVDSRTMLENEPKEAAFAVFRPTEVDQFLNADTSVYRIADVRQQIAGRSFHPNFPAYNFHQQIGGYSAAKIRRYQDLMDFTAQGSTSYPGPGVAWDILNTKYAVTNGQPVEESEKLVLESPNGNVYARPTAMPRAWFVNRVEVLEDIPVLERIRDNAFDPADVAFVPEPLAESIEPYSGRQDTTGSSVAPQSPQTADSTAGEADELPQNLDGTSPDVGNGVQVVDWQAHRIELKVNATGNNFLVVSEIYYPPAWHALLDGKPVETIRTDYLLRGLVIPQGEHSVIFEYQDEKHDSGVTISLIANILLIAIIAAGAFLWYRNRNNRPQDPENQEHLQDSETDAVV